MSGDPRLEDFASSNPDMGEVLRVVESLLSTPAWLLILGETGVGKGRLAEAVHSHGPTRDGEFVAVHCCAQPAGLLESELFGHEMGAFTGATERRRGAFELAAGGTIFLDEIGELSVTRQLRLLHVLDSRAFHRLGSERPIQMNARVIAATNRHLPREVAQGRFRPDLYHRLGAVSVTIPPLRVRRDDIHRLALQACAHFCLKYNRPLKVFDPETLDIFRRYSWPGNVRELQNIVERVVLTSHPGHIRPADLPSHLLEQPSPTRCPHLPGRHFTPEWSDLPLRDAVRAAARIYLALHLAKTDGRVGETARRVGLSERGLCKRMKALGLSRHAFVRGSGATEGTCSEPEFRNHRSAPLMSVAGSAIPCRHGHCSCAGNVLGESRPPPRSGAD